MSELHNAPMNYGAIAVFVQIQIYLAEEGHAASGVLRAIVKDSDDPSRGPQGQVYLDSDGQVSTTMKLNGEPFH